MNEICLTALSLSMQSFRESKQEISKSAIRLCFLRIHRLGQQLVQNEFLMYNLHDCLDGDFHTATREYCCPPAPIP